MRTNTLLNIILTVLSINSQAAFRLRANQIPSQIFSGRLHAAGRPGSTWGCGSVQTGPTLLTRLTGCWRRGPVACSSRRANELPALSRDPLLLSAASAPPPSCGVTLQTGQNPPLCLEAFTLRRFDPFGKKIGFRAICECSDYKVSVWTGFKSDSLTGSLNADAVQPIGSSKRHQEFNPFSSLVSFGKREKIIKKQTFFFV